MVTAPRFGPRLSRSGEPLIGESPLFGWIQLRALAGKSSPIESLEVLRKSSLYGLAAVSEFLSRDKLIHPTDELGVERERHFSLRHEHPVGSMIHYHTEQNAHQQMQKPQQDDDDGTNPCGSTGFVNHNREPQRPPLFGGLARKNRSGYSRALSPDASYIAGGDATARSAHDLPAPTAVRQAIVARSALPGGGPLLRQR